jgi:hypothetical protein
MKRAVTIALFPLVLFTLNFYFCKELFTLEYSQFMGSIEAAYITISRYMIDNWRDLTWFPLWYGGIPFQNTYPPFLHAAVAMASVVFRVSPALAYHAVTAFFYCMGPVTLYALTLRLTGSRWCGLWAGLAYSVIPPSYFLMPSVRAGMGGEFSLRRLQALMAYGEGPHITALAMLPLGILCLDLALAKRRPQWYVLAAATIAVIVLSNWLGALALAISIFAYLLAQSATDGGFVMWLKAFGIGAMAYAFVLPWIPPSTIQAIQLNALHIAGDYVESYRRLPIYCVIGISFAIALKYAMERLKVSRPIQFSVMFAILISALPLGSEWFGVAIVPQPERYHLEMDLAICLAIVSGTFTLAQKAPQRFRYALASVALILCLLPTRLDRRHARRMIKPVKISETAEYEVARWFDSHVASGRVLAPGTISFWMNAFTDTPQVGGGFDQGRVSRSNSLALYQLYSGENAGVRASEIALLWMKAYGVQALSIGRKPFIQPERFHDLTPAARFGEDIIYWVPERSKSLAHVVPRTGLVRALPVNGLDVDQLRPYVKSLDDPVSPLADFRWTSRHSAEIHADLMPAQVLSVQITYHPGWHATVQGVACSLHGDGLGQIVVEPSCQGSCDVRLSYDGGSEMRVAKIVCWSSVIGCIIWIAFSRPPRRDLS